MKSIFEKLGINYDIMKLIIKHKMIMDNRRGENGKNILLSSLLVYFFMGAFSAPLIAMNINPVIKMSLYFSFFMIMILSVFITDFSSVILDVNDKDILLTKGVNNKTLNTAKVIHILSYISLLSLAIGGGAILFSLKFGISFTILLVVSIVFIDIFMLIITAIMYTTILKLFNGEKLKDMINAFQIGFLLIFVLGFQFVARAFQFVDLQFIYKPEAWHILIPPMWFGANFNILQNIEVSQNIRIMSILSILIPIISLVIYIKMIPVFENNLQKLNDNSYKKNKEKKQLHYKVGKLICKNQEEKVFFDFTYNILSKDRDFKTKIYPSLAMGIFMPLLMIMTSYDNQGIINYINSLSNSDYYFSAYLCALISQNIITLIKYSKEYEGAWIYNVLPIKDEGNIYSAMFKASMYKLVVPMFVIMGLMLIPIFKLNIVLDLVIIFVANIIVTMFTFKYDEKDLPFSREHKNINSSSGFITMIKSMFIVGALALMHFAVRKNIIFKVVYLVLLMVCIKIRYKKVFYK